MIAVAGCAIWALYALRLKQATAAVSARLGERLRERERIARELHDTLLPKLHCSASSPSGSVQGSSCAAR